MVTSGIRIESTGFLEKKPDAELLAIYNEVCGTAEAKLPGTRAFTVERILKVLAASRPGTRKPNVPKKDKPKSKYPGVSGRPHQPFDLPPKPGPRIAWRGSIRARVLEACKVGATIEKLMEVTGVSKKRTYHYVRQLNKDMGWGLREIEGVISVYDT